MPIKLKPKLNQRLFDERLETAQWYIEFSERKEFVVISFDETNFHEANEVAPGQCFEVLPDELDGVPINIRFGHLSKETSTQEIKVMYGMACCPYGPIYFKFFDHSDRMNRKGNKARGVDQDFFLENKIFEAIREAALRVIPAGKQPFLLLDKAPGHRSKDVKERLNEVWGEDMWRLQAGKMPDANDGDVGIFPFMKRELLKRGATTEAQIHAKAKEIWSLVTPNVCRNVRERVIKNMEMVVHLKGGNWYDESAH